MKQPIVLRKPSKKYYFMHRDYREEDKRSVQPILKAFAEEFSIQYDSINVSHKAGKAIYRVHSSEKGEGDGYSVDVWLFLIFKWYEKYVGPIEYERKEV